MSAIANRLITTRFPRPPRTRRRIPPKSPKTGLPSPPVKILIRDYAPCRLSDHYFATLQDDLMYMTYRHESKPRPPPRVFPPTYDLSNPYAINRMNPPRGGGTPTVKKLPDPMSPDNIVQLQKISIHTMVKSALVNRSNLIGPMMAFRALTGETFKGGGRHTSQGVQITKGRKSVPGWIRPGQPTGLTVDLHGPNMYDFLATLVEFVLPRLRDFQGFEMPPLSATANSLSAVSGVVSFGLPPAAMKFFPQIETNEDAYPQLVGMNIHLVTNAHGLGAQNRARALASGFQIPFLRAQQ